MHIIITSASNSLPSSTEDTVLTISIPDILLNDNYPDGNTLSIIVFTKPANGVLTRDPNGDFLYLPENDFHGDDPITCTVSDSKGGTHTATVTITVQVSTNEPPITVDVTYITPENTQLTILAPGKWQHTCC